MEQAGGNITIASTPGSGTAVTITLPLSNGLPAGARLLQPIVMRNSADRSIVIVDDKQDLLDLMRETLMERSFSVTTYSDPLVFLAEIEDRRFDNILLDWHTSEQAADTISHCGHGDDIGSGCNQVRCRLGVTPLAQQVLEQRRLKTDEHNASADRNHAATTATATSGWIAGCGGALALPGLMCACGLRDRSPAASATPRNDQ